MILKIVKQAFSLLLIITCITTVYCNGISDIHHPVIVNNKYQSLFDKVEAHYLNIPEGLLKAVSFTYTRFEHLRPVDGGVSCVHIPATYGLMGLTADGKGYFNNNLSMVAELSGIEKELIIKSPEHSIEAYALTLEALRKELNLKSNDLKDFIPLLKKMCEIPDDELNAFPLESHIYAICLFLSDPKMAAQYNFQVHDIDFQSLFGRENYKILRSNRIDFNSGKFTNESGRVFKSSNRAPSCQDFPTSIWNPADVSNFSSRSGTPVSAITIHDVEGTYAGCISWFQNPISNVSAHYVVRSIDGQITQMVCESDKGWHVNTENPYTIGYEHEGYAGTAGWYTESMYQSSAAISRDICNDYNINPLRCFDGPSHSGISVLGSCIKIKGHQNYPNNSHSDPGIYWDWEYYYQLVNNTILPVTLTNTSGNFYDTGGSGGNYGNDERSFWLIEPAGASEVTLSFTSFDIELNWDYLYIYDGDHVHAPLIGVYTGTSTPGTVIGNSGKLLIEFRSDCATVDPGWAASWSSTAIVPACPQPTGLSETVQSMSAVLSWSTVTSAQSYLLRYKQSLASSWSYSTVSNSTYTLSGIAANAVHKWQVASLCGVDTSGFSGSMFTTSTATSETVSSCNGKFKDSGGDLGVYLNSEDYTYTIDASGGGPITVSFNSFNVENGWDFLYIHDGNSTAAAQISGSPFTGTTSPGTIVSSGDFITFRFTSDSRTTTAGWSSDWSCAQTSNPNDLNPPTTSISNPLNWETSDFLASFTDIDNESYVDRGFYLVGDFDGSRNSSNDSLGFLKEDFNSPLQGWNSLTGIWSLNSNAFEQSDENEGNSNAWHTLEQGGGETYLYSWDANMTGSGTNRRSGIHFFVDDPTTANRGNSYFIYYRVDSDKCQIYKVTNDSWVLQTDDVLPGLNANTWVNYKVIFNSQSGEIEAFMNDIKVSEWTDPNPHSSGSSISLRSGGTSVQYDDVRVFKLRGNTETITVGSNSDMVRIQNNSPTTPACFIHSLATDSALNWSQEYILAVNVDWTSPDSLVFVYDGLGSDSDTTNLQTELSANWSSSLDSHSDVSGYYFYVGLFPGDSSVVGMTWNGNSTSATITGLSLDADSTYYFGVVCVNGAGLLSNHVYSNGIVSIVPSSVPAAQWSVGNSAICQGEPILFQNSSTNANSYAWSFQGATTSASTNSNPSAIYDSTGVYQVELIASGPGGSDTLVQNINVNVDYSPQSSFSSPDTILSGLGSSAQFNSSSLNASSYLWDFGDGNTSTLENPSNTYNQTGYFTVTLITSNGVCADDTVVLINYIFVQDTLAPAPVANYTIQSLNICQNESLNIINNSSNSTSWQWTFPSGNPSSSNLETPQVSYAISGTYPITLISAGPGGTDSLTSYVNITVSPAPSADFSTPNINVNLPNAEVSFTNLSVNANSYFWTFGDGGSSVLEDPLYSYPDTGIFTVTLVAMNGQCDNDTVSFSSYITVGDTVPDSPNASFTVFEPNVCSGDSVSFSNLSLNATSWLWSFAGGSPSTSVSQFPSVYYPVSGSYPVELIANGAGGGDTASQLITVSLHSPPTADFTVSDTSGSAPAFIWFTNNSVNATDFYWEFGDASSSSDMNPWHLYNDTGTFSVSLIASNPYCGNDTLNSGTTIIISNLVGVSSESPSSFGYAVNDQKINVWLSDNSNFSFLSMYDLTGKLIYQRPISNKTLNVLIDVSTWSAGLYVLKLQGDTTINRKVFVK